MYMFKCVRVYLYIYVHMHAVRCTGWRACGPTLVSLSQMLNPNGFEQYEFCMQERRVIGCGLASGTRANERLALVFFVHET